MEISDQPRLRFHGVDIIDLAFELFNKKEEEVQVNIDIDPSIFYPKDSENTFKILMQVKLEAKEYFKLKLTALGNFEIIGNNNPEFKKQVINVNSPAIMFPYVRSFISLLTSNVGKDFKTITIPPRFFNGEIKEINLNENNNHFEKQDHSLT
jgi:preprotein translocase subunit SecB